MTIQALVQGFVTGDVEHGRASAISVNGRTLYSYAYPLAYRGRDVNGNTTVFLNTASFIESGYPGGRNLAYSVTTNRHRRTVDLAAMYADLNVIECQFAGNLPDAETLSNDFARAA